MDDIKIHTPTKASAEKITQTIKIAAAEVGLELNVMKSAVYNKNIIEEENLEAAASFLPVVQESHKYLGIKQVERDTNYNIKSLNEKIIETSIQIFTSKLSISQKVKLYSSTVPPAAIYITGNLYTNESRAITLKKCKDIDAEVRKMLVENKK